MLIDEVTIKIASGHGGRGAVSFRKTKMALGPNGGKGGNVIFKGVENINALEQFCRKKEFTAEDGRPGASNFVDGAVLDREQVDCMTTLVVATGDQCLCL